MATKQNPLLCELHAHTDWSDGALSVRELCDLYGRRGFDVLAITDHTTRDDNCIREENFDVYLESIVIEAKRARCLYDLLVVPGLELTYDDPDPGQAGHALAIGLRSFVGVADGLEHAVRAARERGAALIAAHPYTPAAAVGTTRGTAAFAADPERWTPLVDRFELFNRHTLFSWVAETGRPGVATGDFHQLEHLATWKTLVPCAKDERAVVEYLRSSRPTFLVQLDPDEKAREAQVA
jgi:predicted metal-dependent phosphoesterase TrpH